MSVRDLVQDRRWGVAVAVLLLLIAVSLLATRSRRTVTGGTQRWFYDVQTGELFVYAGAEPAPVTAPSGGEGVQAFVFACGECTESNRRIGYLEKYTPEGLAYLKNSPLDEEGAADPGYLVGHITEDGSILWVKSGSAQGRMITEQYRGRCQEKPKICDP